jgi:hypothetical protein
VARNDNPDDDFYSEPTQAANYGGVTGGQAYSEVPDPTGYQPPLHYDYQTAPTPAPQPQDPWYRKPAALVLLGALAALVIALAVYAVVQLMGDDSTGTDTTGTSTTTPTTTAEAPAPAPAPGEPQYTQAPPPPPPTETVTLTETPTTTEAPTTTTEQPTTTAPPTETVTETETVTQTPTRTFPTFPTLFPRPGDGEG